MVTNVHYPSRVTGSKHISYWLPIPKNAYCSIRIAIEGCYEINRRDHEKNEFKWVAIRNPFARLYSCWSDKINTKRPREKMLPSVKGFEPGKSSFESFLNWIMEEKPEDTDAHWMLQDRMLRMQNFQPNFVLRVESLAADWKVLAEILGLNSVMPRLNRTRSHIDDHTAHVHAYTDSLRMRVAEHYRMDFERFGYDPDTL